MLFRLINDWSSVASSVYPDDSSLSDFAEANLPHDSSKKNKAFKWAGLQCYPSLYKLRPSRACPARQR